MLKLSAVHSLRSNRHSSIKEVHMQFGLHSDASQLYIQ